MRYAYDLHIHSALSPCADEDMTPVTVVGRAKLAGLDFVAIADHNAIDHVRVAMAAGEAYGIKTVPAVEVQTNEDIHLLCLFPTVEALERFFGRLPLSERKNRPDLFGEQPVMDEDDNIIGKVDRMLLDSVALSSDEVFALAAEEGGAAVPAHIDRDANSMLKVLGDIPGKYAAVELSTRASAEEMAKWARDRLVIVDSDAHTAEAMKDASDAGWIELEEYTVEALVGRIARGGRQ